MNVCTIFFCFALMFTVSVEHLSDVGHERTSLDMIFNVFIASRHTDEPRSSRKSAGIYRLLSSYNKTLEQ